MDLLIILLFTVITIPVVEFTEGIPRIILGVIFILVFPGYSLMAALFPAKENVQGVERAALSLVLSFAIVALTGLVLNYTPWEIRLTPIVVSLSIIIIAMSLTGLWRRNRLSGEERFNPLATIRICLPEWHSTGKLDRALTIGLVSAVIGAIATLAWVIAQPKNEEAFTDFYLLGPEGMMENYPQQVVLGEEASVILGMKNHENEPASYIVSVTFDGEEVQEIGPVALNNEEEWRQEIILSAGKVGDDQKVEFALFKGDKSEPYLNLHLWLDVKDE